MSSSSAVSGEERTVDLPPPEEKQKTEIDCESDGYDSDGYDETMKLYYESDTIMNAYDESFIKSGGFDVILLPDDFIGNIRPTSEKFLSDMCVLKCIQAAIECYNNRFQILLELVKVLKVMAQSVVGARFYITFDAKDAAGITNTYQAVVFDGLPGEGIEVESFRLKPQDDCQGSSNDWFWVGHIYKDKLKISGGDVVGS